MWRCASSSTSRSPRCCTNNIRKELHVHGARLGHSPLDPEQHHLPVSRRRGPQAHDARQRRHHLDPRRRSPAVHKKIPPSGRARADGTPCGTSRRKCCAQASRRALAALLARSLRAAFDRHADGLLASAMPPFLSRCSSPCRGCTCTSTSRATCLPQRCWVF